MWYVADDKSTDAVSSQSLFDNEIRKVNDEYMEEYENKVQELNGKLQELLAEKNEYEISTVDMDAFVNGLTEDTALEFNDIEIFSFMEE